VINLVRIVPVLMAPQVSLLRVELWRKLALPCFHSFYQESPPLASDLPPLQVVFVTLNLNR